MKNLFFILLTIITFVACAYLVIFSTFNGNVLNVLYTILILIFYSILSIKIDDLTNT